MGNSCSRNTSASDERQSPPTRPQQRNPLSPPHEALYLSLIEQANTHTETLDGMAEEDDTSSHLQEDAAFIRPDADNDKSAEWQEQAQEDSSSGLESVTQTTPPSRITHIKKTKTAQEKASVIKQVLLQHKQQMPLNLVSDTDNIMTALMVMKRRENSSHWDIHLEDFKGRKSWLLSDGKGKVFCILNLELLLPEAYIKRHSRLVDTLLNTTTNVLSAWNDLSIMLGRPIQIQHPHTKKPIWVEIDMKYNDLSKNNPNECVYFNVTLKEYDSPLVSSSFFSTNQPKGRNNVHFTSLLSECDKPQSRVPQ